MSKGKGLLQTVCVTNKELTLSRWFDDPCADRDQQEADKAFLAALSYIEKLEKVAEASVNALVTIGDDWNAHPVVTALEDALTSLEEEQPK